MKKIALLIGLILTAKLGRITFEDHQETWYNLLMHNIVDKAHDNGLDGEYWEREDGCKMLAEYIICAGAVDRYGECIRTSRGDGLILDTGDFAKKEPTTIDIAVTW